MNRLTFVLAAAVVLALGLASMAMAADAATKTGTIKSVDGTAKTFVLTIADKPELTFTLGDKTTYTLDTKEAKLADVVKVGAAVTVTYTRGEGSLRTATKVEATSPKK